MFTMGAHRFLLILVYLLSLHSAPDACSGTEDVIEDCPSFCACTVKASTRGTLVNCTARNLSTAPSLLPSSTEDLYLDHNSMANLDLSNLPALPKLVKLVITHSKLSTLFITDNSDYKMPRLEVLDLSHNELTQIPRHLPKSLRTLHLSHNKLQEIQGNSFSTSKKLKELYLDHNQIRRITLESFHGDSEEEVTLANLDKLSLKKNRIQSIAPKAFENLISLSALNLAKNKLTTLEAKIFYRLLDLEHLDLHSNKIQNIEDETLYMLKSLKFLSLKYNQLVNVPRGLPMLEWLDLSHNKIRNISSDQRTDIYPAELFILAHNPLHCDCHMLWLKEIFDRREYMLKHIDLKPSEFIPSCASPRRVSGESWDHLGDEMFTCNPEDEEEGYEDPAAPEELHVKHGLITDKAVQVIWSYKGRQTFESVFIQYYIFGQRASTTKHIEVSAAQREYSVRPLKPESNYIICVIPKLAATEDEIEESLKPISLDHCLEVATTSSNMLENVSFIAVAGYYMLGMMGTIIAVFSCIGGLALVYGLWNAKCSDWSAKYAAEAAMPDLDIHTRISQNAAAEKESAKTGKDKEADDKNKQNAPTPAGEDPKDAGDSKKNSEVPENDEETKKDK